MESWSKNLSDKVELRYQLLYESELDDLLENSKLQKEGKEAVQNAAKNIITAEILMEDNELVNEELQEYYRNTKSKFQELKNRLKET